MTDREVVIAHLDALRSFADVTVHPVVSPDKWDVYSSLCDYIDQIKTEVEILLKEQEAVKPKKVKGYNPPMYTIYEYECEKCKSLILNKQPFCMGCGKTVKWE